MLTFDGRFMNGEVAASSLSRLLEPHTAEEFLASSWGQTYKHIRGRRGKFASLLPWERLNEILRQHRLDFPRLRLMREGKSLPVTSYLRHTASGARGKQPVPRLQPVKFTEQLRAGATLVLDAVHELHEPLEELVAELEFFFRAALHDPNTPDGTLRALICTGDDHEFYLQGRAQALGLYGEVAPHPLNGDTDNPRLRGPRLGSDARNGDFLTSPGVVARAIPRRTDDNITVGIKNDRH